VEQLLETVARYINRHSEMLEQQEAEMAQLRTSLGNVLDLFSELATYQRQHQEQIRQNQEQIRQNQEEIRRIWEYLLDQSRNGRSG
jgi:predicted  nucleic acid-binding Zn-ribbon protein